MDLVCSFVRKALLLAFSSTNDELRVEGTINSNYSSISLSRIGNLAILYIDLYFLIETANVKKQYACNIDVGQLLRTGERFLRRTQTLQASQWDGKYSALIASKRVMGYVNGPDTINPVIDVVADFTGDGHIYLTDIMSIVK